MFCTRCGRAIESSAKFCSNCGAATAGMSEGASFTTGYTPGNAGPPPTYSSYPGAGSAGGSYPRGTLVRPRSPRMIAGVCSGIAEHYGWDVTIVRLVLVLSVVTAGFGIGLYLILWVVVPEGPYELPSSIGTSPGSPSI